MTMHDGDAFAWTLGSSCCVCGACDARALVDVVLMGGTRVTLCGSHDLMHRRSPVHARSVAHLRELLGNRRERRDRRSIGDELGDALTAAFSGDRRVADRRL
jgi:hypothetical protein